MAQELVDLGVHIEDGTPLVNSRDVARVFEKRHDHVLRDIDDLLHKTPSPNLGTANWFRRVEYLDANAQARPSFDMTRDGFTLLVFGYSGERAMAFKVAYIETFNRMEQALRDGTPITSSELLQAIREIVSPLRVRFDHQDVTIQRIETRVDAIAEDVGSIKLRLLNSRRRISATTKAAHVYACKQLGGRCPCCGENDVTVDGMKSPFAEFDHFYQASYPDVEHTWLICKKCHTKLTTGRLQRHQAEPHFRAYQDKRCHLAGQQPRMIF